MTACLRAVHFRSSGLAQSLPSRTWRNICNVAIQRHQPIICKRRFASKTDSKDPKTERFNFNDAVSFSEDPDPNHKNYPLVTASQLKTRTSRPREVKMLVRDFIADSLYNPNYGYFSKRAVIVSPAEPFDFQSLKNSDAFNHLVSKTYSTGDAVSRTSQGRQLWHTPTEIFKPWYGRAIAQCLTADYMLKFFPYEDFIVYEMGAGNGTLAGNFLDFLREDYPDVYDRTSYRIIEISSQLAAIQAQKLQKEHPNVEIIHQDILSWNKPVLSPCYFLATEVIDNFPHDVIRYRTNDLQPAQCVVVVDGDGAFSELYEPVTDPVIARFLTYRNRLNHRPPALSPTLSSSTLRFLRNALPFAPNLSSPEFIPTNLLLLLETLRRNFPLHRLLLSDFFTLPDTIPGYNAPVVQTRYRGTMIPCTTYLVQPGYFDIFFPTNFERLSELYDYVMTLPQSPGLWEARSSPIQETNSGLASDFFSSGARIRSRPTTAGRRMGAPLCNIFTHKEFLSRYANLEATALQNGENPLLDFYQNVKFLF